MKLYLVGAGRAGRALALACAEAGHEVLGVHTRSTDGQPAGWGPAGGEPTTRVPLHRGPVVPIPAAAELVWLAVPDRAIEEVARALWHARALTDRHVLAHASGSAPARLLRQGAPGVRAVVAIHPLQSLTGDARSAAALRRATFSLEGEAAGVDAARSLLGPLDVPTIRVSAADKPLYHASAVLASNALVALADAAAATLARAGIPPDAALDALLPLMEGTLSNLRAVRLPAALTGPASRGDAETIAAHREALTTRAPELWPLYAALTERIVVVAQAQGIAPTEALQRVSAIVKG